MFSFPLSLIFIFHMCPIHFSFFKNPLFSTDKKKKKKKKKKKTRQQLRREIRRQGGEKGEV